MSDRPQSTEDSHPRVQKDGEGRWLITSSGDPVTDALQEFLWHATADLTPQQACRLAEKIKDMLIDDEDALECWGLRLTAELDK